MTEWPANTNVYQINTQVWLNSLSRTYGKEIKLNTVPDEVLDEIASYQVDSVWLMGIWYRGPATRASALNYIHEYQVALPDITEDDIIGSAYAICDYKVDPDLGGRRALATLRKKLRKRGMKLILDFVPNHVSTDHAWISERPDYFITGNADLLDRDPGNFFEATTSSGEEIVVAHGRDPYFPGWIDTAQLNAFSPGYREATIATLLDMASQCDGVRCDMAMLMMDRVFETTWGWLGHKPTGEEFWCYVIPKVRAKYPDFLFVAETYWGMDYALHLQGFDYTYDKTMYDRILSGDVNGIYAHLGAELSFLRKNMRFIENHDEVRAATSLGVDRSRPAAALILTIPGATLLHDGQFVGRRIKLPVQIKRQPNEREYPALKQFYLRLLEEADSSIYEHGEWSMFGREMAIGEFDGHQNVIAYGWRYKNDYRLIILNMSGRWSQAVVNVRPWKDLFGAHDWEAYDVLHDSYVTFSGPEMVEEGLLVDLDAYQSHIYRLKPHPQGWKIRSDQQAQRG